ncbi:MAG: DNA gyrase inhibitor YacG [Gammaproteobacteria bacterium]|jgi:hypothetical protein|nr:DNA gyrase inhibitor YacG [Gammaproteobacteria bacterium]MBT3859967.1 DNA gyrase inhibitor YacG [Gammaproteobacteria bacterium]MBT3986429.1 DNA gyrase inhibitor YacG [Gammaproteobacteria bacterium]MBT4254821.1 DNA gyrase inhibitor YacG [Gammaproteobacteria bacterium]MBT4582989.1 DNA gyrase inhibitor YacG [Gammaproteobacteria bacterium]
MTTIKKVNCPSCSKELEWKESNEYRPFCSERCKLVDFGDWAMERHSIPGEEIYPVDSQDQDQ